MLLLLLHGDALASKMGIIHAGDERVSGGTLGMCVKHQSWRKVRMARRDVDRQHGAGHWEYRDVTDVAVCFDVSHAAVDFDKAFHRWEGRTSYWRVGRAIARFTFSGGLKFTWNWILLPLQHTCIRRGAGIC
jgi:hypothetical protein